MFYTFKRVNDGAVVCIEAGSYDDAISLDKTYGINVGENTEEGDDNWEDKQDESKTGVEVPSLDGVSILKINDGKYAASELGKHGQVVFLNGTIEIH